MRRVGAGGWGGGGGGRGSGAGKHMEFVCFIAGRLRRDVKILNKMTKLAKACWETLLVMLTKCMQQVTKGD